MLKKKSIYFYPCLRYFPAGLISRERERGGGGGGGQRERQRIDRQRQSVGTEGGGEEELPSLQLNFLYSPRGQEPGQKPSLTHLFLIPSTVPESLLAAAHRAVIVRVKLNIAWGDGHSTQSGHSSCRVKYSVGRRTQHTERS